MLGHDHPVLRVLPISVLVAWASACSTTSVRPSDLPLITLESNGSCEGRCGAFTVALFADGRLEYDGFTHMKRLGHGTARLPVGRVSALREAFLRSGYLSFASSYQSALDGCSSVWSDFPTTTTSFRLGASAKRVVHNLGCGGPPELPRLQEL